MTRWTGAGHAERNGLGFRFEIEVEQTTAANAPARLVRVSCEADTGPVTGCPAPGGGYHFALNAGSTLGEPGTRDGMDRRHLTSTPPETPGSKPSFAPKPSDSPTWPRCAKYTGTARCASIPE